MKPRGSPDERFFRYVDIPSPTDCWEWTGCRHPTGYGKFTSGTHHQVPAHRFAYESLIGPIPEGLTIDHLCRNRACVNPTHLEPVTNKENILRGTSFSADNARKSHCKHGHALIPANVYTHPCGSRSCRECRRATWRAYYRRLHTKRASA